MSKSSLSSQGVNIANIQKDREGKRLSELRAWLAYRNIKMGSLSKLIGVHPSMITHIVKGDRAPAKRIKQLADAGIPKKLLPKPSNPPGRPPKKKAATAAATTATVKRKY